MTRIEKLSGLIMINLYLVTAILLTVLVYHIISLIIMKRSRHVPKYRIKSAIGSIVGDCIGLVLVLLIISYLW